MRHGRYRGLQRQAQRVSKAVMQRDSGQVVFPEPLTKEEIEFTRRMLRGQYSQGSLADRIYFDVGRKETTIILGKK